MDKDLRDRPLPIGAEAFALPGHVHRHGWIVLLSGGFARAVPACRTLAVDLDDRFAGSQDTTKVAARDLVRRLDAGKGDAEPAALGLSPERRPSPREAG